MTQAHRTGRPRWPRLPAGLAYGGDYNPEQWPEEVWLEDVALMKEAGVNLVTVAVFAWSHLQPAPDRWDLDWLERVLDLLDANGIAVDLATATASPPPWFRRVHPEAMPVTETGVRFEIGARQHYCPSSPAYRAAADELVERLAGRFGHHPAVSMWHINNEFGCHVRECFCDVSTAAFREWLRDRHGTIERLNDAWTTSVWAGRFGDWDEVQPPRAAPAPRNPGQVVDWRRFCSDALLGCFESERTILGRLTPDLPVTTNFTGLNDWIDPRRFAADEEVVSADLYPDPLDPGSPAEAALSYDLMRSLGGGRPWLLLEQARAAVDWRPVNVPRTGRQMRAASLEAVARGADGIMFFQWRGSRGGAEAFHSTMLPAGGRNTRGFADTVALGREIDLMTEVKGSRVEADAAVLVDWPAWWALEQTGRPTRELRYAEQVARFHAPLYEANIAVDVRSPGDDLSGYRLVMAPNLFLLDPVDAARLQGFVRGGGVLVVGPYSGVVDAQCRVPAGHYPALLRDLLGIHWEEVQPIPAGSVTVEFDSGERTRARIWRDHLDLAGADAVARYADGELAGVPAVTRNRQGAGEAWYLGCVLERAGTDEIVRRACAAAGVRPAAVAPTGVRVTTRRGEASDFLFCINRGAVAASVTFPAAGADLLTGARVEVGATLELQPLDAVVVRVGE